MSSTIISIFTAVYIRADTVGQALRSVVDQTHQDIEKAVLDGLSTDGALAAIGMLGESRISPVPGAMAPTQLELFGTLRDLISGRGALIISHRLLTIRHVDYTYLLDRGRISEHGTHDELIQSGGRYADLFGRQAAYFR